MAKGKHQGKSWKDGYKRYSSSNQYAKNRVRDLERHLKKYPNDEVAKQALARINKSGIEWKRKKPRSKGTSAVFDAKVGKTVHIHAKALPKFKFTPGVIRNRIVA